MRTRAFLPLVVATAIFCACGTSGSSGDAGIEGSSGSSGGSGSGGTSGSGTPGSGVSSGSGGGSGSGVSSGSGGGSGSSAGSSSGSSGSSGSGSSGDSGTDAAPGPEGGTAVGSPGCGTTSTMTFGMVPNENANAAPGSGNGVGTGAGGWVTITDPNAGATAGSPRGFAMRLPDNYDKNKPYWLFFDYHWNGGTSDQEDNGGSNGYWWAYYGMQRESKNGAIFVAPQGLSDGWYNTNGEDVTFTDDMIKLIEANYCVDTTHLIAMGFSFGAGMSYELACARAKVFHAVVLYEGGQISGCDAPGTDPIAYMQIQGNSDTTVSTSLAQSARDKFVTNNGCTVPAQEPTAPAQPPPYENPGGHICTNYSGCSAGHPLRWCVSQSGHGPGPIDGTSDLYNSCATSPKTCSASCPCTWTPDDVWSWLTTTEPVGSTFQTKNATSE